MGLLSLSSLRPSPLLTTTLQAILINILANLIAQIIEIRHSHLPTTPTDPKPITIDGWRVLHFVIWTCITVPPNFRWQQWLERRFPTYYEEDRVDLGKREGDEKVGVALVRKRNFRHTILKILCDQGVAAPINCTMFLIVMTLLRGGSSQDCISTVRNRFWALKFAGWRIWPLVGLFNFTFVPVDRRIIVSTAVGLCWNVFLALFITK